MLNAPRADAAAAAAAAHSTGKAAVLFKIGKGKKFAFFPFLEYVEFGSRKVVPYLPSSSSPTQSLALPRKVKNAGEEKVFNSGKSIELYRGKGELGLWVSSSTHPTWMERKVGRDLSLTQSAAEEGRLFLFLLPCLFRFLLLLRPTDGRRAILDPPTPPPSLSLGAAKRAFLWKGKVKPGAIHVPTTDKGEGGGGRPPFSFYGRELERPFTGGGDESD